MRIKVWLVLFLTSLTNVVLAQNKTAIRYSKSIEESDMKEILTFLASDSLEGRETGQRGQKVAAEFISEKFKEFGLIPAVNTLDGPSYYQKFEVQKGTFREVYLSKGNSRMENFKDFLYYSRSETFGEEYTNVVFAGNGDSTELSEINLAGNFVAVVKKEFSDISTTLKSLQDANVKGYFLIIEDKQEFAYVMNRYGSYLWSPKMAFEFDQKGSKVFIINTEMAKWIFETPFESLMKSGLGTKATLIINADMHIEPVNTENIAGYIKGSEKPDEVLVISAHYDHVGIINGEIHNGADDDGSGTTALLELAEAFSIATTNGYRPKRTLLFLAVSGEEKGLLGSEYYVEHPLFPLENTVADLNIDMIGRIDDQHLKQPRYIYVIGADKLSQDLHKLSERVNKTYSQIEFDYTYNADNDPNRYFYRSDHYNFAKKGIPVIFYFNGSHADYHRPTDTVEKINFPLMKKRIDLIFYTAWEIANREERIQLDSE